MNEKPKADVYDSLENSHQSFRAIGLLEAINGAVILRGREGQRDVAFTVDRAIDKYEHTLQVVAKYFQRGVRGWDELAEIVDTLKHKILEAIAQSRAMNMPVSETALNFEEKHSNSTTK